MKKLDAVDEKIVALLTENARMSNREVARVVGLSETGVRKRLKRLNASNDVKITAVVDPAEVGLDVRAFVRLTTTPATARRIVEAAAALEFVSFAALTTGPRNVVLFLLVEDHRSLADIIHEHIRCWDGIHAIETIEVVRTVVHRLDLALIPDEH
jgi:Lrp/AsnC family transcriptional regulator for asnA, asnC and gidA